jgi:hypothetical protein
MNMEAKLIEMVDFYTAIIKNATELKNQKFQSPVIKAHSEGTISTAKMVLDHISMLQKLASEERSHADRLATEFDVIDGLRIMWSKDEISDGRFSAEVHNAVLRATRLQKQKIDALQEHEKLRSK